MPPAIPAPPADNLRKAGFPSDAQCTSAVDRFVALVKTDVDAREALIADNEEGYRGESKINCDHVWSLAKVDCVLAASKFLEITACMRLDFSVEDAAFDPSTAPGHATAAECDAVLDRLAAIGATPKVPDAELIADCRRRWRPVTITCVKNATTADAIRACREEQGE